MLGHKRWLKLGQGGCLLLAACCAAAGPPPAYRQSGKALAPVLLPMAAGCFQMGSPVAEAGRGDNERQHRVCVKAFKLGKYEVTVAEFRRFAEATGHVSDAERNHGQAGCWSYQHDGASQAFTWDWRPGANWRQPLKGVAVADDQPATCLSFVDVAAYIAWLNRQTGQVYRLPTEAEWEYAARAGTGTARFWGSHERMACGFANVADDTPSPLAGRWPVRNRCQDGHFFAASVGALRANPFGLHDMLGNVWEWTCSVYDETYSGKEAECLAAKPEFDTLLAIRGGAWNADMARVRAAHRNWGASWSRQANLGFRLAQDYRH